MVRSEESIGRAQRVPEMQVAEFLQAPLPGFDVRPRYNVSPGQMIVAVRGAEQREIVQLKWGLIPVWAKDTKIAFQCLNARSETVATKPAFRSAYKTRRCLIPADGYYEWLRVGKEKLPYLYEYEGGHIFSFAGLWERWKDPEDAEAEWIETCSLLTTDANELASEIHDRMPVIVDAEDRQAWLSGKEIPLVPFLTKGMSARRVSTFVNNSRNEGEGCIAAADDPPDEPAKKSTPGRPHSNQGAWKNELFWLQETSRAGLPSMRTTFLPGSWQNPRSSVQPVRNEPKTILGNPVVCGWGRDFIVVTLPIFHSHSAPMTEGEAYAFVSMHRTSISSNSTTTARLNCSRMASSACSDVM
jgi:putative SOS response-associated peptidase YedK